jgi:hypothetical protein
MQRGDFVQGIVRGLAFQWSEFDIGVNEGLVLVSIRTINYCIVDWDNGGSTGLILCRFTLSSPACPGCPRSSSRWR